jgi:transcriptional regulator with XRE-family HTH domain
MYEQFIVTLRAILEERGISPYRLAEMMKNGKPTTNRPWLWRILNREINPTLDSIAAIANALDVKVEKLLGEDYQKNF